MTINLWEISGNDSDPQETPGNDSLTLGTVREMSLSFGKCPEMAQNLQEIAGNEYELSGNLGK